ncbi:MAG: hypothetical protein ACK55I_49275, partial [bacterium]
MMPRSDGHPAFPAVVEPYAASHGRGTSRAYGHWPVCPPTSETLTVRIVAVVGSDPGPEQLPSR